MKKKVKIGILGGSFDPAHKGHLAISKEAKRRFDLKKIIWAITKKNPFKDESKTNLSKRIKDCKKIIRLNPFIKVKFYEDIIKSNKTIDLINYLKKNDGIEIYFLMGADNLSQFNKWKSWKEITLLVPIAVIARPGYGLKSQLSPTARYLSDHRVPEHKAHTLKYESPPTWTFITPPLNKNSSSTIRKDIANA